MENSKIDGAILVVTKSQLLTKTEIWKIKLTTSDNLKWTSTMKNRITDHIFSYKMLGVYTKFG